jgi:hypothetical protein
MSVVPTAAARLAAAIPTLIEALDAEMGDDFSQPSRLLMFEADESSVTFGIKELAAGQHPLDELLGFAAPEEWAALGTVCHGWASRDLTGRPSTASDRFRIRSVHVVARDGTELGGFRTAGEPLTLQGHVMGMVPDALRRSLGLGTPPADIPAAHLTAADWLDLVVEDPRAARTPPTPYGDWEDARWDVVTGQRRVSDLTPTMAAWMDAGMFARWMTPTFPRTDDHLAAVRRQVDASVYAALHATLEAWNVLT